MFRRKHAVRRRHPDPRVEAALQRIISLRAAVGRAEDRIANLHEEEERLRHDIRFDPGHAETYTQQIEDCVSQAAAAEAAMPGLHDQIAKAIGELTDDDLLWLDPREEP